MTVVRPFNHSRNARAAAEQDYEMAKLHVEEVLRGGNAWDAGQQERFRAAMGRQEEARERLLNILTR